MAPGAERHQASLAQNGNPVGPSGINHTNNNELVLNYSTDFPELPDSQTPDSEKILGGAWNKPPAVRSQIVTQVLHFLLLVAFDVLSLVCFQLTGFSTSW